MGKIKNLINLIKTSAKAQIITGVVAVGVVGVGVTTGVLVYNHRQAVSLERQEEIARKDRAKEMKEYCEETRKSVEKFINSEDRTKILNIVGLIEDQCIEEDRYSHFEDHKKDISELYDTLLEYHINLMKEDKEILNIKDYSIYVDNSKEQFDKLNEEFDKFYKDNDYSKAHEIAMKCIDLKISLEKPAKPLEENPSEDLGDSSTDDSSNDYVADSGSIDSGSSSTGGSSTGGNAGGSTGGSSNSGSNNSGNTSNGGSNTAPTPEPVKPSGIYQMSDSDIDWYNSKGIDIQNIQVGVPFYLSHIDEWSVILKSSDGTSAALELLSPKFGGDYVVCTGGYFARLNSTYEDVYIYSVYRP